jgi:predicted membrane-bound dolichyl-phosphate-mannose-protein mannosyltransferase
MAGGIVMLDWWKSRKISLEMLLVLANAALIAFMPRFTWVDWIATLRLGIGLVIACLLYFALHRGRLGVILSTLWSSSFFLPIVFAVNLAAVR